MAVGTAIRMAARVWAVDYRMPPDHPFPAALDDCLAAYRALLGERSPERIVIGGASAGGNLAAALILRARDEGLPLPAAVVLMTPGADLTEAGDSHQTNLGLDPLIPGSGRQQFLLYAAGHDLRHPYLSPLNGDFSKGFPPAILTTGTRDMLLSDTVLLHRALRRAGIPAELHVTEAGRARRVHGPGAGRPGDPGRGPALRRDPLGPLTVPESKSTAIHLERTLAPTSARPRALIRGQPVTPDSVRPGPAPRPRARSPAGRAATAPPGSARRATASAAAPPASPARPASRTPGTRPARRSRRRCRSR